LSKFNWFDKEVGEWIFSHPSYPVEYGGETPEEVTENFPKYLAEFIKHRLNDNLNPLTEVRTGGHGGKRIGASRPKGSSKEAKTRISLPEDLANWFKENPAAIDVVRKTISIPRFPAPPK
jgi:hypothetical protein